MQEKKAQAAVEYLVITAVVLVIIVAIFGISIVASNQNIKSQQLTQSLDGLVKTTELVYALGKENVLYTDVFWPQETTSIDITYKCKTTAELSGCGGEQEATSCSCTTTVGGCNNTDIDETDCIKYSAISVSSTIFGDTPLEYVSKAPVKKIEEEPEGETLPFLVKNFQYSVKVYWTDTGYVAIQRYAGDTT